MFGVNQNIGFGGGGSDAGTQPDEIANLFVWFRADLGVTGDPVTAWADQSGNGNHIDAVDATPNVLSGEINGHDAINFVSADGEGMEDSTDPTINNASYPIHMFLVVRPDSYADGTFFVSLESSFAGHAQPAFRSDGTQMAARSGQAGGGLKSATPPGYPTAGNWGMIHAVFGYDGSGGDIKAAWNNDSYTVAESLLLDGTTGIQIMRAGAESRADGAIAEFILYTAEISGDDLTGLKTYINNRYGLW